MTSQAPPQLPALVGIIKGSGADIKEANDAFLQLLGYSRAEFDAASMNWRSMTPPEFHHLDEAAIKAALESRTGAFIAPYQKPLVRKDGTRVPVLIVAAFIPETRGKWLAYVVDLTAPAPQRVATSDADVALAGPLPAEFYGRLVGELVRERERMRAMLDNTDALLWAVDRQCRLLAANAAFRSMMLPRLGRELQVGDVVLGAGFPAEAIASWERAYARALAGERFSMQMQVALPDRVVHLEAFLSPMIDEARGVVGATVVSRDVTARVAVEEALRESEARFRLLAASLPFGIYLTGPVGPPIYVNPRLAEMWGSTPEAMVGNAEGLGLIHPEDLERVQRESTAGSEAGQDYVIEFRALLPELGERHIRVRVAPVCDGARITGWVGSVEDETERHAIAAHARQREKMESLGTLAGGIAHDFNNMLSVILGYADLALDERDDAELEQSLLEIQGAARRARDLVRQILAFSRRSEPADERVDLGSLVVEGVRFLRSTLPVNLQLDVRVPQGPLVVRGDAAALQQIVVNLCTNAAHAMSERGGRVSVQLEAEGAPPGGQALLVVCDSGCGMSREVLARIFEPFFTTKEAGEGTGMGLAVVHGVVTSHGGSITVESAVGVGTTFRVSLPLVSGAASTEAELAAPRRARSARVLVVEDERALAQLFVQVLTREGYQATSASNGMEALRVFSAGPDEFDLVVSDLSMPGLSGDRLAQAIHVVRPGLPFVLVSGFLGALGTRTPSELGVHALLAKPHSPRELLEAVRDALDAAPHVRASRAPGAAAAITERAPRNEDQAR